MFHPCRKTAPIRVIHLNRAIGNGIEVIIVAVQRQHPAKLGRLKNVDALVVALLGVELLVDIVQYLFVDALAGARMGMPGLGST